MKTFTLQRYQEQVRLFRLWASSVRLPLRKDSQVDAAMDEYFEHLYFKGASVSEARYTLWGWSYINDVTVAFPLFLKAHRALRGWVKASPEFMRDPMPWEVAMLAALFLATVGLQALGPWSLTAARALLLHFDIYCRPGELLALRRCDVVRPSGQNKCWTVIVGPSPSQREGTQLDMAEAARGLQRRSGTKTGQFDNSILVGQPESAAAGRSFMPALLAKWHRQGRGADTPLFHLTHVQYARAIEWACARLGLESFAFTPHCVRHGGATADFVRGARTIQEIQYRGQWADPRSCNRYRKAGRYNKIVAQLPHNLTNTLDAQRAALIHAVG